MRTLIVLLIAWAEIPCFCQEQQMPRPVNSLTYFVGKWSCTGPFMNSSKTIEGDFTPESALYGNLLMERYDDHPPFAYRSAIGWGRNAGEKQFVAIMEDSSGALFLYHSAGLQVLLRTSEPSRTVKDKVAYDPDTGAIPKTGSDTTECLLCLYGPDNMVFDPAGNIYVTDSDQKTHSRVLKLSPEGKRIAEWHVFATVEARRNGPEGIALDRQQNIYVTDAGSSSVLQLSPNGDVIRKLGARGTFSDLGHLAIAASGEIYVSEGGPNSIHKFAPDGREEATWCRERGSDRDQWRSPETIAIRPNGSLVVEDWGNYRIEIVSSEGKTLRVFGEKGDGPGQFLSTAGVAVDTRGHIFVPDERLHRVQEFDQEGTLLAIIQNKPNATLFEVGPTGVAVGPDGMLYSPDGLSIVKYSRDGTERSRWR